MKADDIRKAAVLGAGTMGHGIAHVLSMAGIETRLYDIDPSAVERGLAAVSQNLEKGVAKGKVEPAARDAAPDDAREAEDMERAEAEGKSHAKGEDPLLNQRRKPGA